MYTVEFKDISPNAICFLFIRVDQSYHVGEKFEATLIAVNASFKECVILIGDTLQRNTIMMDGITENETDAREKAVQLGKEWFEHVKEDINKHLTIPTTIIYWDKLTTKEEQEKHVATFNKHHQEIKNNISTAALHFIVNHDKKATKSKEEKNEKKLKIIDVEKALQYSQIYITEIITKFIHLKTLPYSKDFKTKSLNDVPRPIHFCYPFKGDIVVECVIEALKILLDSDPNVIFTNIQITGEPRPNKSARQKSHQASASMSPNRTNGIYQFGVFNKFNSTQSNYKKQPLHDYTTSSINPSDKPKVDLVTRYFQCVIDSIIQNPNKTSPASFELLAQFALNLYKLENNYNKAHQLNADPSNEHVNDCTTTTTGLNILNHP